KGQRGFTEALPFSSSTDGNAIPPVLPAIIIRIEEIHSHTILGIKGNPQYGNGVPTDKTGGTVGDGNTGWLWMNQRLVTIVVWVIRGVEMANKIIQADQRAAGNIDIDTKAAARPPAMKLGINPAV